MASSPTWRCSARRWATATPLLRRSAGAKSWRRRRRTFISSTFWTERIGPTAALKTLEVMERTAILGADHGDRQATSPRAGRRWRASTVCPITLSGLPALTGFSFNGPRALAYKTLITQEMLAKGYLAGTSVYVCTEHTPGDRGRLLRGAGSGFRAHQGVRGGQGRHEPAQGSGLSQRIQAVELMHRSILVLAAHPDDEVLGCGGTIARLARRGSAVHVAFLPTAFHRAQQAPRAPSAGC